MQDVIELACDGDARLGSEAHRLLAGTWTVNELETSR